MEVLEAEEGPPFSSVRRCEKGVGAVWGPWGRGVVGGTVGLSAGKGQHSLSGL